MTSLPATTGWLLRGKDGRLTAYAPTAGGVLRWTELRAGGPDWTGPELLAAEGLLPHLAIARGAEGFVHLLAVRKRPRADGTEDTDLVHAIQFQTGRPLRDWFSLGNPHGKDHEKGAAIGLPSIIVDDTDSVQLFVRNANGALSVKRQAATGRWKPWGGANPKGKSLTGETAAALTDHGLVDLLVPAGDALVRWFRGKSDSALVRSDDEPVARAESGTLVAERTGPGRLTHFWRDAEDGAVRAWRPGTEPVPLGGRGIGPLAVLRTPVDGHDCVILAQCGTDGRPSIAAYPTEDEAAGLNWTRIGDRCTGAPALALDGTGRVVLAAMGEDGALRVARQKAEPGLALEAWTRI
ncbi:MULTISPECIES: hypothetical protein [unclassified Streptomyces]|uniref:hypothetical protein n=1 Tax=unclassified Streptomyces TaxID=2593676 RepID=UPI002E29E48A|nr:hypothetical protein [Streptomyces sp. NBC_01429]